MAKNGYTPEIAAIPPARPGVLPVSEKFLSIQGEGRYTGAPAVFLRLGFCPLGCIWCDTRYTWESPKLDTFDWMSLEAIAERILELAAGAREDAALHLVLTGGEPLVHQQELPAVISQLRGANPERSWFVEVETSGTIFPAAELMAVVDWWNCSPKLPNNGRPMSENLKPDVLSALSRRANVDFKFVIQTEQDLHDLATYYEPLIPREKIILMPEGTSREQLAAVSRWLIPQTVRRGYRFSTRLHVMAWGNERGR